MLTEVNLSSKPGLVDRINCGTYKDVALEDFHRSALVIQGWLSRFIEFGTCSTEMVPEVAPNGLRPIDMAYGGDMFRTIAGVNTYKGSIFSLGLLCMVIGRLFQLNQSVAPITVCTTVASFCRGLIDREPRTNGSQLVIGQRLYQQPGFTGARGEAEASYPLVINHALLHYLALLD